MSKNARVKNLASRVSSATSNFVSSGGFGGAQNGDFQCVGAVSFEQESNDNGEASHEAHKDNAQTVQTAPAAVSGGDMNFSRRDNTHEKFIQRREVSLRDAMIIHEVFSEPVCKRRHRKKCKY